MAKKVLTPGELFRLRSSLQVAALAALMGSRRWEPGDLAFQGGTSLNLVHGSPRFSEDLDFMIRGGLTLTGLEKAIERLLVLPPGTPAGLSHTITLAKEGRNPHAFTITLSGDGFIGTAKVKVELWHTSPQAMDRLQLLVRPVVAPDGTQTHVPVETLDEILADKVFAIGARDRIKPRDIFDLWWIQATSATALSPDKLALRLDIYPRETPCETARKWLENAQQRVEFLASPQAPEIVAEDLRRWLPSTWPMRPEDAALMVEAARAALLDGMAQMAEIEAQLCSDDTRDCSYDRCR